jgi:hypothetical protein
MSSRSGFYFFHSSMFMTNREGPGDILDRVRGTRTYQKLGARDRIGLVCYLFDPLCTGLAMESIIEALEDIGPDEVRTEIGMMHETRAEDPHKKRMLSLNYRSRGGRIDELYSLNHQLRPHYGKILKKLSRQG